MKALFRLIKIVFVLFAAGVVVFAGYNFGYIGRDVLAWEEEQSLLSSGQPYVLVFYAESCAVSAEMLPILREVADNGAVSFVYSNVDVPRDLQFAHSRGVQITPTVFVHDGAGQQAAAFYGTVDAVVLTDALGRLFSGAQALQP